MAEHQEAHSPPAADDRAEDASLAELSKRLTEQVSRLAHDEIALAKAEMTEKGRRAGLGAGMFGGAGLLGVFALGLLTACAVAALDLAMPLWLAALIVGLAYALGAGMLALIGKSEVRRATPLTPERTAESVKEDMEWVKTRARAARR